VLLPVPPRAMAEQDWTPFTITSGHLQKLVKLGFMTATELTACRVPEDHALPVPAEGYMVCLMAFYDGDSVCHCTSSTAHCYNIMALSCTI
jgi:hypothetical protein